MDRLGPTFYCFRWWWRCRCSDEHTHTHQRIQSLPAHIHTCARTNAFIVTTTHQIHRSFSINFSPFFFSIVFTASISRRNRLRWKYIIKKEDKKKNRIVHKTGFSVEWQMASGHRAFVSSSRSITFIAVIVCQHQPCQKC